MGNQTYPLSSRETEKQKQEKEIKAGEQAPLDGSMAKEQSVSLEQSQEAVRQEPSNQETAEREGQISKPEAGEEIPGKETDSSQRSSMGAAQAILANDEGDDVKIIETLVILAMKGEKGEREAIARAKKMFKNDPHSLDNFHDLLLAKKQGK